MGLHREEDIAARPPTLLQRHHIAEVVASSLDYAQFLFGLVRFAVFFLQSLAGGATSAPSAVAAGLGQPLATHCFAQQGLKVPLLGKTMCCGRSPKAGRNGRRS